MKILYVVNHVSFFVSHRLPIALEAKKRGHEVALLTGKEASSEMEKYALLKLRNAEIDHHLVNFKSDGINPFLELFHLFTAIKKIKKYNPDVIHSASPKGNLYAGLSGIFIKTKLLIISISGQGFMNTKSKKLTYLRKALGFVLQKMYSLIYSYKNKKIIVQNHDDKGFLKEKYNIEEKDIVLIKGSGVNMDLYYKTDINNKKNQILFPARVLFDKGAIEFFKSAETLKKEFPSWNFLVAGASDYASPSAIPRNTIEDYVNSGAICYLGHVEDIDKHFRESRIVCLPSYREGFPKALMEASAASCAVVTTDVTGCRDAIIDKVTGILVKPRNVALLTEALRDLLLNEDKINLYAKNGFEHAKENFCQKKIIADINDLYD